MVLNHGETPPGVNFSSVLHILLFYFIKGPKLFQKVFSQLWNGLQQEQQTITTLLYYKQIN